MLAIGRSGIDSALGRRYLRVDVRNCTARPIALTRLVVAGHTRTGRTGVLRLALTPSANRPDRAFRLAARRSASAGVSWRADPGGDGVDELRVTVTSDGDPQPIPLDLFDLHLTTRLDYYPWVSNPRHVFS